MGLARWAVLGMALMLAACAQATSPSPDQPPPSARRTHHHHHARTHGDRISLVHGHAHAPATPLPQAIKAAGEARARRDHTSWHRSPWQARRAGSPPVKAHGVQLVSVAGRSPRHPEAGPGASALHAAHPEQGASTASAPGVKIVPVETADPPSVSPPGLRVSRQGGQTQARRGKTIPLPHVLLQRPAAPGRAPVASAGVGLSALAPRPISRAAAAAKLKLSPAGFVALRIGPQPLRILTRLGAIKRLGAGKGGSCVVVPLAVKSRKQLGLLLHQRSLTIEQVMRFRAKEPAPDRAGTPGSNRAQMNQQKMWQHLLDALAGRSAAATQPTTQPTVKSNARR